MYYRRYFSGSIAATNATRITKSIVNGSNLTHYCNQTDVLLSAIKQTLEDVGIQCEYGDIDGVLIIDGVTLQICATNTSPYISFNINGIQMTTINSNYPFSGTKYSFYVTLKGDIEGILQIFIGSYTSPQIETTGFIIGKGVDLRDDVEIRVIWAGSVNNVSSFYVVKNDKILDDYKSTVAFGLQLTNVSGLNNNGIEATLVECVAQPGRFKLSNCYFGNAALAVNSFYNIGGDIYYSIAAAILVKCVSTHVS